VDLKEQHRPARGIKHRQGESLKALGFNPPDRELP
jgi:hypothetical protein